MSKLNLGRKQYRGESGSFAQEYVDKQLGKHKNDVPLDHADESVTEEKLAAEAVTEEKIADSAVTDEKIGSRTIDNPATENGTETGLLTALLNRITQAIRTQREETQMALGTKADKQTAEGGFSGGRGAEAYRGGAVGRDAMAKGGGAVGDGAKTTDGFAGGKNAETAFFDYETGDSYYIDAVQLGTGLNINPKTLQIYDHQLLDADGHIPDDRMPQLDTKADKQTAQGGFAGGEQATTKSGGAIGSGADAEDGGAVGSGAIALAGGAVGDGAKTLDGFAGGKQAKTIDVNNNGIDAIQLGTGTNSTEKTLKIYDHQLLDADGHIPEERIPKLDTKVDKVDGKELSSNDYTTEEKTKLAGVAEGANNYTHPSSHPASMITQDSARRFVSDAEKTAWNSRLLPSNIKAGSNVTIATSGNDVTISSASGGENASSWIATTAGTSTAYTVTFDPAPTELYVGMQITIIPHVSSSATTVSLNVNGLGAKYLKCRNASTGMLCYPHCIDFLKEGKPITLLYDGYYWVMMGLYQTGPMIYINNPTGSTVTVTVSGDGGTISKTGTYYIPFDIPCFGTWKITSGDYSKSIYINTAKIYNVTIKTLQDSTWTQIAEASKSGSASSWWSVGDEKDIVVGDETLTLVIVGFNHDIYSDGSGKAGITFGLKNLMATTRRMEETDTNANGFTGSEMYTWLQDDLFSSLPSDLKKVIKPVNKKTSAGNQSATINTDSMNVFLFSEIEVFGNLTYSAEGEGEQYKYFATAANRTKKLANGAGVARSWWERSPHVGGTKGFCILYNDGRAGMGYSSNANERGICFGFCV